MQETLRWQIGLIIGAIVWVQGEIVEFAIHLGGYVIAMILVYWTLEAVHFLVRKADPE